MKRKTIFSLYCILLSFLTFAQNDSNILFLKEKPDVLWIADSIVSVVEIQNSNTVILSLDSANLEFHLIEDDVTEISKWIEQSKSSNPESDSRKKLAQELNDFRTKVLLEKWNFYQNEIENSLTQLEKEKIQNVKTALAFDSQTILTSKQLKKAQKELSKVIKSHNHLIQKMLNETDGLPSSAIINSSKTISEKEKTIYFLLRL